MPPLVPAPAIPRTHCSPASPIPGSIHRDDVVVPVLVSAGRWLPFPPPACPVGFAAASPANPSLLADGRRGQRQVSSPCSVPLTRPPCVRPALPASRLDVTCPEQVRCP